MKRTIIGVFFLAVTAQAASVPKVEDYFIARGSALIRTVGSHTIVVYVHLFGLTGESPAGPVDHIFHFWSAAALPYIQVITTSAGVEYRGDQLTVVAADREEFYSFALDRRTPEAMTLHLTDDVAHSPESSVITAADEPAPDGFRAQRFRGYGLNHQMGPSVSAQSFSLGRGAHVLECMPCDPDDGGGGGGGGASCNSGGVGATSCQIVQGQNSCRVDCSTGYYACCLNNGGAPNPPSCFCYPNP